MSALKMVRLEKAPGFLACHGCDGYARYVFARDEGALAKEALRDGKFLIRTNTTIPAGDVVLSYKTLMGIERAFRQIKNFLDVGPVYPWNEKRVRGHIFVCVLLAYLFEQEMQVLYSNAPPAVSPL
uniref:hypothetical protein n=1 Tax=Kyrpidia tusciae TaxID=33943 RepID=UPI0003042384|nr:hypothetical protein [Kyrpidia tusciae]